MVDKQRMVSRAIGLLRTTGAHCQPVRFIALYALMLYGGDMAINQMIKAIGKGVRGIERQNLARVMESMQNAGIARVVAKRVCETGGSPSNVWSVTTGKPLLKVDSYHAVVWPYMTRLADVIGRNGAEKVAEAMQAIVGCKYAAEAAALAELGIADVRGASLKDKPTQSPNGYTGGGISNGSEARQLQAQMLRALCGMGAVEIAEC